MPTREQVQQLSAMQELERRGTLPEQYQVLLDELRSRGIAPPRSRGPAAGGGELQIGPLQTGVQLPEGSQQYVAGAGKAASDLWRGMRQRVQEQQEQVSPGTAPGLGALQTQVDESRGLDEPLMETGPGLLGNVAGNVTFGMPAAFIGGAGTYPGAALLGGAFGGAQPTATGESPLGPGAAGAVGGLP
jgi:hypothetical protein